MVGGHARGGVCACAYVCVCARSEEPLARGPHSSDNEPAISLLFSIPCLGLVMREIN